MADLLVVLFSLPTRHLHEYGRLLLKLATCFEVVSELNTGDSHTGITLPPGLLLIRLNYRTVQKPS